MSKRAKVRPVSAGRIKIAEGITIGTLLKCTDNTGARILKVIGVMGRKTRLRRLPSAGVGDVVKVAVKSGSPDTRRKLFHAVIVRQRRPYKRPEGIRVQFEDNAAVLINPSGEPLGSEIRGPIAREAAVRWPRLASLASIIV